MRLVASFLCRYHHGGFYQSIYEISWLQTYGKTDSFGCQNIYPG